MRKVVFYGGSFDPPHRAHRALLEAALQLVQPDWALVVPTGNASSYKHRQLSPAADRLAMCELAFADLPQVQISAVEAASPKPNYTIDTLEALEKNYAKTSALGLQWYLLLGADQMAAIHTWRRWRDLLGKVTVVLADRAGLSAAEQAQSRHNSALCSGLLHLPLQPVALSSTVLRQRLAAGADAQTQDWTALLAPQVLRYIAEHSLYR